MAKVLFSTFGSLGDVHPKLALALEMRRRGHDVTVALTEAYREKIGALGLRFHAVRPELDPEDRELGRKVMDANRGTEYIFRELLMPNLQAMHDDLLTAVENCDLFVTGEVLLPARSVYELTGKKWVSTSLAPISFISSEDPCVFPGRAWSEHLRVLPSFVHRALRGFAAREFAGWMKPYKEYRQKLGLNPDHDPMLGDKYSPFAHLALFSKTLAEPQEDWAPHTIQTGFCFYDGQRDLGKMPDDLEDFLNNGEPPIVFTLGSAAVLDARDFFHVSARAAEILGRRAVLTYGMLNDKPDISGENIGLFDYAPYSEVFPRSALVVHQGGVGTTSQVMRAGVPHLVVPFAHDQFDNAARCRRGGIAESISRESYNSENAVKMIVKLTEDAKYRENADAVAQKIAQENGALAACDEIERVLSLSK